MARPPKVSPQPVARAHQTIYPVVTPNVRPVFLASLVSLALVGGIAFFLARPVLKQEPPTPRASPQASRNSARSHQQAMPNSGARAELEVEPSPKRDSKPHKGAKKKSHRSRKPNVYKIAKLLKPALKKCTPRDLMGRGHPVWYSMSVSLSVGKGKIRAKKVTVKPTDTDPEKIHFKKDYDRVVTSADLNERVTRMTACLKSSIGKFEIPADSEQKSASGSIKYSMGRDGVPYGI